MVTYYIAFMVINAVMFSDMYFMMSDPFKSTKGRLVSFYVFIVLTTIIALTFPMFFGMDIDDIFDDLDYYWAIALLSYLIISFSVIYTIRRFKNHGIS